LRQLRRLGGAVSLAAREWQITVECHGPVLRDVHFECDSL
jgi:hypothetical protein